MPAMKFWKKKTDDRSSLVSAPPNLSLLNGGLWQAEEGRTDRIQDGTGWKSEQQRPQTAEARAAEERQIAEALERDRLQRIADERRREEEKQRMAREQRQHAASTQTIRQLRHLIREKHKLDHYVWNKRKVLPADRRIIIQDCRKADAALKQIYDIVGTWGPDQFPDPDEWLVAERIKDSIAKQRQREQHPNWCSLPPWEREENGESRTYDLSPY